MRFSRVVSAHIASDSEAILTKPPPQFQSLDCFPPDLIRGLLAMTAESGSIQTHHALATEAIEIGFGASWRRGRPSKSSPSSFAWDQKYKANISRNCELGPPLSLDVRPKPCS